MKRMLKTFAVLIVVVIALFSFSIVASATEVSNTQNGLVASINSEKDIYKSGEDIELTFKVTNTNDFAVENVSLEAIIPEGLKLKSENDTNTETVSLASGETLELALTVVKESSAIVVPIETTCTENTTETSATEVAEIETVKPTSAKANSSTSNSNSKATNSSTVKTGRGMSYVLVALICLVCAVVVFVSFRFKKKAVKYLSIVLCVCISISSVVLVSAENTWAHKTVAEEVAKEVAQESDTSTSFDISKNVTVDGKDYEIKAIIKYIKQNEDVNDDFIPSRDATRYANDDLYTTNPNEDNVKLDRESGMQFVNNEVCVYIKETATQADIELLCEKYNAYIVGKNYFFNSYKLRFKESYSYSELNNIISDLNEENCVDEASINLIFHYQTSEYYPTTKEDRWNNDWNEIPSGANWGVEAIKAPNAWEYIDLMKSINVGIYDEGFDINHEDLKNNIKNSSLYTNNPLYHGSHVAGIIGAEFDNGIGINGVSPTAKLSVVNYNEKDYDDSNNIEWAMTYLIDINKCKVINMSLGPEAEYVFAASKGELSAQEYLKAISANFEKILKRLANANDFIICTSAGNDCGRKYYKSDKAPYGYYEEDPYKDGYYIDRGVDGKEKNSIKWNGSNPISGKNQAMAVWHPLSFIGDEDLKNRIIVVGAIQNESDTTEKYSVCSFSNVGDRVDVVAPGYGIESTIDNNSYEKYPGTSMASPHVAGIAAMLYSLDPKLTGDEVKRIICNTATREVDGYKLVDAESAVKEVLGKGTLSGGIVSSSDNTGVSNARVDLYIKLKSGTKFVDTIYTDKNGDFSIELQGGSYELRFNKDGYKTTSMTITVSKNVMTVLKEPVVMERESSYKEDFINAILESEGDLWNEEGSTSYGYFKLIDLNFDGKLEFIKQWSDDSGYSLSSTSPAAVYYYKDGKIIQCNTWCDLNNELTGYYNMSNNSYILLQPTKAYNGYDDNYTLYNQYLEFNGTDIATYCYSSMIKKDNSSDNIYYKGAYGNSESSVVSKDSYNSINSKIIENCVNINMKYDKIDGMDWRYYSDSEKREALEKAYDSFTYDKY